MKNKIFLAIVFVFFFGTGDVFGVIVDELPTDNLITNPWFRSQANNSEPGLDGWIDTTQEPYCITLSQKDNNLAPSPDSAIPTDARWASGSGMGGSTPGCASGIGGVDGLLHQVVAADESHRLLKFQFYHVTQYNERSSVTVYGGPTIQGPWTQVWLPWETTAQGDAQFHQTPLLTTVTQAGFPFYKLQIQGRFPVGRSQGFKFTGVYFATEDTGGTPTPSPVGLPGDLDDDGDVDVFDFNLLLGSFGTNDTSADVNGDGLVDIFDVNILIGNFGT